MADPSPGASVVDTLDLGKSFGVMLLSTIIVAALYGITFLQSLWYYERFPEDSWALKATVGAVWLLDTATIALNSHAIYYYLVINYNNPAAFANQVWSVQVELLVTYTVVLIVQIFFILRIYRLRPRAWYIPAFMGFIALVSYGLILAVVVGVFEHPSWNGVAAANPRIANWVFGMVVDTGITVVLCWYMWSEKVYVRRRTHRMLNRIIIFSVNRGAVAAVIQVLTLLTKLIWPQNMIWLAFHNALSKVYANSMLATLNSRTGLRDMMQSDSEGTELNLPTVGRNVVNANRKPGRPHDHRVATLQFASIQSSVQEGSIDTGESTPTVAKIAVDTPRSDSAAKSLSSNVAHAG